MKKINMKLYQACIAKRLRMYEIAKLAEIENSRFSKILNGNHEARPDEKRALSKILKLPQKELFL